MLEKMTLAKIAKPAKRALKESLHHSASAFERGAMRSK